jgi:hypothetical protein
VHAIIAANVDAAGTAAALASADAGRKAAVAARPDPALLRLSAAAQAPLRPALFY